MKTAETIKKYKTPLMIAGVAIVGYTFYRVYRKRNPTDASSLTQDEKDARAKGQALSYTLSSYQGAADTIFNAWFQRFNPLHPVDETIVLSVINKMKNDLDVIQLIRAFGKRRSPVNFLSLLTPNVSLPEWINIGLTEPQIAAINTVMSKKGISYKF
jgi:hypothetical protein